MTAPSPIQLPLSDKARRPMRVATFRPTAGMESAKRDLDLNEDYILSLIADHSLSYAWDVGLGKDRRMVRILGASIEHFVAHGSKPHALTEDAAFALLLPPGLAPDRPYLTNGQIQRALNCVSDHVLHLIDAKDLTLQPKTDYKRGPNGSALITITSFQRFLKSRRLP